MKDTEFLLRDKYAGVKSSAYDTDCARLDAGEPLAYVIGWTPFLDCRIYLDSHPLIPRSETEFWVEAVLQELPKEPLVRILDLFAGSGAIGIALLKNTQNTVVDFGEIDSSHLPTIQKNIAENEIASERTRIIQTDVWSNIENSYEYVLANPPYVSRNRIDRVQNSVLSHEPHNALFADDDGFALIAETIHGLTTHLAKNGRAFIEHEPEQAPAILVASKKAGLMADVRKDQFGVARYTVLWSVA